MWAQKAVLSPTDVRFGSKADILRCDSHVRFTPKADIAVHAMSAKCQKQTNTDPADLSAKVRLYL